MPEKFKWNYTETKPAPLMDRATAGYTSLFHLPNITETDKVPKTSDGRGYRDKNPYYEYLTDKQKEEWRLGQNRRKNFDTYYNKYLGSDPLYRSNEQKWLAEYLAFIESRWNPQAQNEKTNAKGLFQIMPQYWGSRNSKNIQDQFLRYKEMMDANSQGIIRLMKSGKVQKSSIAMSRLRNGYDANAMRAIAWLSGLGGLEGFLLKGQNRSDGGTTQAQYAAAIVQRNLNNPKNKKEQQQYAYAYDPDDENTEQEDLSQYEDQEPAYYYDDEDNYYTPQQAEYAPPEDFDFNNYQSDTEQVGNEEQPYNPLQDVQMSEPEEPSSLFQSQNNYTGGEDDYDYDNPKDFQSYLKQKQALEEQEQAMRIEELNAPTALNQYVEQLLEEPNKQFTKPVVQPLQAAMGGHLFGNGGDGRTTLPHVGDSWRNTETGESGTVVGYAPDVPYMGEDGKLYPTTSPVVKYDSGETLFGVTPEYTLPEYVVPGHLRTPADNLDNMFANILTAGLASTEQSAADKLRSGNYIEGGLEAMSPFLFASNPIGNVTRGLYGGYHLFNNEGLPKTYKEFTQGNYWNGAKSLAGDALNALLLGQGVYGTADDALNLAARLGNTDAKSIQFARALNKDIKNTSPSINPRSIASNFEVDPISGNLDVDYTLFDAFGDKMGQAWMAGVDDGTRYVNGIKSTNIGKGVTEDIYNTAVLDTNRGLRSGVTTLYSPKKTLAVTRGKMGYIPEGFNEEGQPVTRIISPSSKSLPQRINGNHYQEISSEPTVQYNELTGEFEAVPTSTLVEEPLTISWEDAVSPKYPEITAENAASITPEQWTAAQDAAVARGDIAEAQRLRDLHFMTKAPNTIAKRKDGPLRLFHGTKNKFNSFDLDLFGSTDGGTFGRGIYTSPSEFYASQYGENVIPLYMKLDNPRKLSYDAASELPFWEEKIAFGPDFATGIGVDGVYGTTRFKQYEGAPEYVSHKPGNVKLADAVTYDDKGVRIPLGERDNFNMNDIRFSIGTPDKPYYWDPESKQWASPEVGIRDARAGKREYIDWVTDPKYIEAAEQNKKEAEAMGLKYIPWYERPNAREELDLQIALKPYADKNSNVGAYTRLGHKDNPIHYNMYSQMSLKDAFRHEYGHNQGFATTLWEDKLPFEQARESYQKQKAYLRYKASQVFNKDYKYPEKGPAGETIYTPIQYQPWEVAMNMRDMGVDLGIKVGEEYPGFEKALKMINEYNGSKRELKDGLNLTKEALPYVWKALNGTQFTLLPYIGGGLATYGLYDNFNSTNSDIHAYGGPLVQQANKFIIED